MRYTKHRMSKSATNLVIVESPAKAKTIAGYLGPDFDVKSSVGHIRSIAKKPANGKKPIDTDHDFETIYEVDAEKKKIVAELKKAVKAADTVWLATDEDREGEAIAWHLYDVLRLDPAKTHRIAFHEITKTAILEALENPRKIDMDFVKAQQARQILDRLVGFELSPVVWRKVPGGKSAGRVQSPAVRLLVERENEIQAFENSFKYKVTAEFLHDSETFRANLSDTFTDKESAEEFLNSLISAKFSVTNTETKAGTRSPLPPFTTSTLQQDANARLGLSARSTMAQAQALYQSGMITYMRTDSVNLSNQALSQIASYIEKEFGDDYKQVRKFKTKSASAQEAHEAIRPTDINRVNVDDSSAQRLYDLIRRRTLASQMANAKIERTTIVIDISENKSLDNAAQKENPLSFIAKGEVLLFSGFLEVYGDNKDETLPALAVGDQLQAKTITAQQTFAHPPARYTEGSLVKKLEDLGIGRPSTYATIISTIQTRGYAEKGTGEGVEREVDVLTLSDGAVTSEKVTEKSGADKGKLIPTSSGTVLSDFLNDHFNSIVDYDFTAQLENELDEIADDKLDKTKMLREFYDPFHKLIADADSIDRSDVAKARELGIDPKSGEVVLARVGRFGPMLQLGSSDNPDKKPRFANFPKGVRLEAITLDEALTMFQLPRVVGTTEAGDEIVANIGRFGPYIKVKSLFVSIKSHDPFKITEAEARALYAEKMEAEAQKNVADFGNGLKVLRGRFGPYVTDGAKNAKIPKDEDLEKITGSRAKEILDEAPAKSRRRAPAKKSKK